MLSRVTSNRTKPSKLLELAARYLENAYDLIDQFCEGRKKVQKCNGSCPMMEHCPLRDEKPFALFDCINVLICSSISERNKEDVEHDKAK